MAANGSTVDALFDPPKNIQDGAHVSSFEQYQAMYQKSIDDPAGFWGEIVEQFYWKTAPNKDNFLSYNFDATKGPIKIEWMKGAVTNICYNVLDRHVKNGLGDKIAFYWEGNHPDDSSTVTYGELLRDTCKMANVLKSKGVCKGDRVAIYMPMTPHIVVAMLACARIGAIHSIVFAGFSPRSLADRILDAKASIVFTCDGAWRGTKLLDLKKIVDNALDLCVEDGHTVRHCICVRHLTNADMSNGNTDTAGKRPYSALKGQNGFTETLSEIVMKPDRDIWWGEEMKKVDEECEPEWLDAEDPLFMLYTSGSTGKPKGVLHTSAGYLTYAATTFKYDFDYHDGDVYWCTADIGWITGHSYVCYGPMANAATSVMFEGTPFYPDSARFWAVCDKYKVNQFYTAPTAIRALMKCGEEIVNKYCLDSLRVLGTVGEPINPEAWMWYHRVIGKNKCSIVDTFWQTETGGHVITPLPGATRTKPGSATFPFFGVVPELLNEEGKVIEGEGEGYLVFNQPWPGIMRTLYGNHERFETTYFKKFNGYYCTGDGARRDKDGYIWVTGRIDDMLNVSGHLLSTAQVESALIEHPSVAETAAVAHPHSLKGECLYCFITLKNGFSYSDSLVAELKKIIREKIGGFALPDYFQEAPALPKTRSGKIMRRVLRKIAVGDKDLGDVSTMADATVVDQLFSLRPTTAK